MIALRDQLALAAPVALRDQARGSAVARIDGGTVTITAGTPVAVASLNAVLLEDGMSRILLAFLIDAAILAY